MLRRLIMVFFGFALVPFTSACANLENVRDNLNEQRALYGLDPVFGDTCQEVAWAFVDYEPLVTTAIPNSDEHWGIITASECRTFKAHLDAYNAVCEDPYAVTQETIMTCMSLGAWPG